MILVDPRTMDTIRSSSSAPVPDATTESLRGMDREMRDVLNRNDVNLEDKANIYQQTLWRYLKRFAQYKDKPTDTGAIRPDERTKAGSEPEDPTKHDFSAIEQDVVQSVPKTMRTKAERLLQRLKTHSDVTWNSLGEIKYEGQLVKNSNLTDLINDVLRKRRIAAEPIGWKSFAAALHRLNIPQDLVGNPERWKYIRRKGIETSPTRLTPQINPSNVALSSINRQEEEDEEQQQQTRARKRFMVEKDTPLAWNKNKSKRKQQQFKKKRPFFEAWESL